MAKTPTKARNTAPAATTATRSRARRVTLAKRKQLFLSELANRANVSASAAAAGVDRATAYRWRDADPVFAAAWDSAVDVAVDSLEAEAWRRATGWSEPVYQKGEYMGEIPRYSDQLMITLLKGHRPERYKDRSSTELSGPGGAPLAQGLVQIYLPGNGRDELEEEPTVEVAAS